VAPLGWPSVGRWPLVVCRVSCVGYLPLPLNYFCWFVVCVCVSVVCLLSSVDWPLFTFTFTQEEDEEEDIYIVIIITSILEEALFFCCAINQ